MGALVLALTKCGGAQDATTFNCISVIDGRRYLKEGHRQGEKPYIASCQTPAIIAFENVAELAISDVSSKSEIREKLEKATGLARNSFVGNLATPCKLAMSVPVMELGAVLAAISQKSAAPPPIESPVFASDGITERYIPRQFCSNSSEKVLQVNDVYFFSNQSLSTVSVRLSSWRDCVRLSIDYNEARHDKGDMVAYLNEIAKTMLVLTD
ncbi:hypothetical protein TGAM01_v206546 [Trichoderma gamsii]|uniref:Condensation domain-containing protein n=1 Tax=Trichoderma gamsii TaxID=398673 RepID=A0A2P4ZJZ9_9HYPO|nr:hypothetical protein TGAM01_v206546 [Trichoderma gamsii]PON24616.1 hypothetical protein TGAM01_v206546 [Trichoderma gamsii]